MSTQLARCFLILPLFLAMAGTLSGQAPVLDQSHTYFTAYAQASFNVSIAQTFTPSISGRLDYVSVRTLLRNPFEN